MISLLSAKKHIPIIIKPAKAKKRRCQYNIPGSERIQIDNWILLQLQALQMLK